MKSLRVAVWGLGPHALRNIIPAIAGCPGLVLHAVCSRDPETVRQSAEAWHCRGCSAPESMLDDPSVDVIYLSTPIGLHARQGMEVLRAGKHLWCEKPLTGGRRTTDAMVQLSRELCLGVAEAFMYLYHPQFLDLQELLASGRLGDIVSIQCRFGIPPLTRPGFRLTPELGGGAFLDVGCYPISAMAALYPHDQPEVLTSEIVKCDGYAVDCSGRALLRYPDGVRATLEWALDASYRNEIDIWGKHGSAQAERFFSKPADHVPVIRIRDRHGEVSSRSVAPENHFVTMLAAFRETAARPDAAEQERRRIAHRALLAERIRTDLRSR